MSVPKTSIQTFDFTGLRNDSATQPPAVSHQPSGNPVYLIAESDG
jgi:hypothetical protein